MRDVGGPFEHVIVGSGINGLVAAATLAKKGRSVCVLERSDRIGGCMRTEALTVPGYVHDTMATTFVLFVTGPAMAALGPDLARHGVEFGTTDAPTGVLLPDGRHLILNRDRAANHAAFEAVAPGDGDALRAGIGQVEANADLLFGLLGGPAWGTGPARLVARETWRRGGPRALLTEVGGMLGSLRGWLETEFTDELTRAVLAPWCLHAGLGPEAAFSGEMTRVIAFALEAAGAPVAKGGASRVAEGLGAIVEAHGGCIRTGADAVRIETAGGRATGVALADGRFVRASRGVIASVTPEQLYNRLLAPGDVGPAAARARRYRRGRANFQMHYALDGLPDWGEPALARVALLHLTPGLDGVSRAVNEAERGLLPAVPTICVGQPHVQDPSRCPEGKAILWLQMPEAPRILKGDAAGEIETGTEEMGAGWTDAVAERFADRIEAILRRHIRNFDAIRRERVVIGPHALEAMNVNLEGGDPYGGATTIDQFFLWRPFADSVNHRTHIGGLYHIGASTHPGPGLSGGSGALLAARL